MFGTDIDGHGKPPVLLYALLKGIAAMFLAFFIVGLYVAIGLLIWSVVT